MLRCCVALGKTQWEIENEYAWIDLPRLLELSGEQRAREMLDNITVASFPHYADKQVRESIINSLQAKLPQIPAETQKEPHLSAEEQYQAALARWKAGGL